MNSYYYINVDVNDLQQIIDTNIVTKNKIVIDLNDCMFDLDWTIYNKLVYILHRVNFETQIVNEKSIIILINSKELLKNIKTRDANKFFQLIYLTDTFSFIKSGYSCKEQFRFLVNAIKVCEIDRVIYLDSVNMFKYKFVDFYSGIKKICLFEGFRKKDIKVVYPVYKINELMGCYIDMRKNRLDYMKYFSDIGIEIKDEENNIVCLCEDNIKLVFDDLSKQDLLFCDLEEFKEIVYMHELGHLVFSYTNSLDREVQEKQANYFSSLAFEGKYDFEIKETTKVQPLEYHNPLLVSNRIKNPKKYEEQVDGLYQGKVVK